MRKHFATHIYLHTHKLNLRGFFVQIGMMIPLRVKVEGAKVANTTTSTEDGADTEDTCGSSSCYCSTRNG